MKKIKKFIPEVILVIVLVVLIVCFDHASSCLKDKNIYDGNYVGGNTTDVYVSMNVKWIESVGDIEGINSVGFESSWNLQDGVIEKIKNNKGWYLADIDIKANTESGYKEKHYENVLIHDEHAGLDGSPLFQLKIREESAMITYSLKSVGKTDVNLAWTAFSGNGVAFIYDLGDIGEGSVYLEKNGNLPFYNWQIVQAICIALIVVVCSVYMVYAFFKNKKIGILVSSVFMLFVFGIIFSNSRGVHYGEWRSIDNEEEFVIVPDYADKDELQVVYNVNSGLIIASSIENEDVLPFDMESDEFKEEYKLITAIFGYKVYPFLLLIPVLLGIALSVVLFIKKSQGIIVEPDDETESGLAEFYGRYVVDKVKYLSDAFKGMETYFEQNEGNREILFSSIEYSYNDTVIESPKYSIEKVKKAPFPGAPVEKYYIITMINGKELCEYELNFGKNNAYLIKYLDGVITTVYEIRKKDDF